MFSICDNMSLNRGKQMNILTFNFLTCLVYFGLFGILSAEKICIPDGSIEKQEKRYISQGLLLACIKEKMIFAWPIRVCECWISSLYGKRGSGFHHGVDLAANKGTDVFAAADGFITIAEKNSDPKSYGNMILIEHQHQELIYKTRYAHLDSIEKSIYHQVQAGKKVFVQRGEKIGTVGATGHVIAKNSKSDPSHLHFEIYKNGERIDPLKYLFASQIIMLKNKKMRNNS
jgi:murein DD-endopeptidase MepM/ murein hydrolase activator NlpD